MMEKRSLKRFVNIKTIVMGAALIVLMIIGGEFQDEYRKSGKFRTMQDPIQTHEKVDLAGLEDFHIAGGPILPFSTLKEKLPPHNNIIVVDGMMDKHGYLNGIPASSLGYRGSPSFYQYLRRLFYTGTFNTHPELTVSEENEAKAHGLQYMALSIGSKVITADQTIDDFVKLFDHLPKDTWIYFHCHHGKGRTSIMLVMADILKNAPQVPLKDIIKRQYLLGSVDLFDTTPWTKGTYRKSMLEKRKRFIEKFYDFVCQRKAGGTQLWSVWNQSTGNSQ